MVYGAWSLWVYSDTELQRRSDTDRVTKKLEDIDLNAAFGEGIPVELPSPTGEEAQLWAYLPKEFGKMKKEEKFTPKKKFARKRNYEDEMGGAVEWLYNADFEEYWQVFHIFSLVYCILLVHVWLHYLLYLV